MEQKKIQVKVDWNPSKNDWRLHKDYRTSKCTKNHGCTLEVLSQPPFVQGEGRVFGFSTRAADQTSWRKCLRTLESLHVTDPRNELELASCLCATDHVKEVSLLSWVFGDAPVYVLEGHFVMPESMSFGYIISSEKTSFSGYVLR